MAFIVIFNIILYALLFVWTYKNMYELENKTKIIYIVSFLGILYIITKIIYNIGGNPIGKELGEVANTFNRTMLTIFIGINGLITMPHIASALNKYKEEQIDEKGMKKRIIIVGIIFVVFIIFEFNYIKDMQVSMLEIISDLGKEQLSK